MAEVARGGDCSRVLCVKALTTFAELGNSLLERARTELREVCPLKGKGMQRICGEVAISMCAALQAAVEDFRQLGLQWDAFLERLDQELNPSPRTPDPGPRTSFIPLDFSCLLCRLHLEDLQKNQ
ncbi:hypothetical protein CRUP_022271, partial [Coryphaenoides rupestris]